jgi:hypothetical protein
MRERKFRSGVDRQWALKQKGVTHSGVKQGYGVVYNLYSLRNNVLIFFWGNADGKLNMRFPFTVCSNKRSFNSGHMQRRSVSDRSQFTRHQTMQFKLLYTMQSNKQTQRLFIYTLIYGNVAPFIIPPLDL